MADDKDKDTTVIDTDKKDEKQGKDDSTDNNDNYGGFAPEDAIVQVAVKHGWQPKDKFGDDDKWAPPDKFVEAQWDVNEAMKHGRQRLERQVDQLTRKLDQMTRHFEDMSKREQDKTQTELKQMRNLAIEEGNAAKVEQIDEQIDKLKESSARTGDDSIDPAISEWMEQNSWYHPGGKGSPEDVQDVVELIEELNSDESYQRLSPKFRLAKIDREIADYVQMRRPDLIDKYKFNGIKPFKSNAPKEDTVEDKDRKAIPDVEGNVSPGIHSKKGVSYSDLSTEEKAMCDSTIFNLQHTGMTREKWLAGYNKKLSEESRK